MIQRSPETSWLVASYVWNMKCSMVGTARVTVIRSCWKTCQTRTGSNSRMSTLVPPTKASVSDFSLHCQCPLWLT
jgi:hypothetical protein